MIFVTLGTHDKTFERLLMNIDELIDKGVIQGDVIVQAGKTNYSSKNMKIFDFIELNRMNQYIEKCDYMISHAGVGTIMNAINHQKKIIAVARRAKFGEHENDHQVEITTKFSDFGYILGCTEVEELEEKIKMIDQFKTKPYESNNQSFCDLIDSMINE